MTGGSRTRRLGLCLLGLALFVVGVFGTGIFGLSGLVPAPTLRGAYASLSLHLADTLHTGEPGPAARLTLGPGGRDIRLAGEIGEGTAARLAALLAAHPAVERLHLTSEGGLVDEARVLGDLIAARGLATYVPDYCVSACTLVFVRGTARYLVGEGRLGFHAPFEIGLFGQTFQADATAEQAAYVAAGVEAGFAAQALAVASEDIWMPDAARLLKARVVTEIVDTDRFPDSTLDDDPTPAGARAAVLSMLPVLEGLTGRPGAVERIAAGYLDSYRAGRSEGEGLDRMRALARREIVRTLRTANDATMVDLGRLLLAAMRGADTEACLALGSEGDLLTAQEVLGGAQIRAFLARAAGQGTDDATERHPLPPRRISRDCAALSGAYTHALAKPPAEAATAVRTLAFRDLLHPARAASAVP